MPALVAVLSSFMWGTADFLGGTASRRLPAVAVYGISQFIALIVLLITATATDAWGDPLGYVPWAVASSVLGFVGMLTFYRALALGPMGIVSPLVALSVLVPVGFGLLQGELPSGIQVIGVIVAIVGILLASGPELNGGEATRPLILATIALFCFGGMYITLAEGSASSPLMTTTGMRITTAAIMGVVLLRARTVGGAGIRDLPMLAVLGILDAGANIAYGWATTVGLLTTTAVLGSLYPVVTAVLAAVFLRERLRPIQYAGVVAVVLAVIMISSG